MAHFFLKGKDHFCFKDILVVSLNDDVCFNVRSNYKTKINKKQQRTNGTER